MNTEIWYVQWRIYSKVRRIQCVIQYVLSYFHWKFMFNSVLSRSHRFWRGTVTLSFLVSSGCKIFSDKASTYKLRSFNSGVYNYTENSRIKNILLSQFSHCNQFLFEYRFTFMIFSFHFHFFGGFVLWLDF